MALQCSGGAPARAALGGRARAQAGLDATTLEGVLAATCLAACCAETDAARPWSILLDAERAALLAALERPAVARGGVRPRQRAEPGRSRVRGGVELLAAFVAAARARGGPAPRIAVVTAAAFDPMATVDVYRSLFAALGAEPLWWPVDAALAAARFERGDCDALARLRRERLSLSQRERIYPDLAEQQRRYCRARDDELPPVAGVFYAGGDQWRLRQAFVHADGRPNRWLDALRAAYASGRIVVGGTSAGAAVQSGAWMLSNGASNSPVPTAIAAGAATTHSTASARCASDCFGSRRAADIDTRAKPRGR